MVEAEAMAQKPLKDPKSLLQEKVQSKNLSAPKYQVVSEEGPDHNKNFVVEVLIDGEAKANGQGKSKSEAEQSAASNALASYFNITI